MTKYRIVQNDLGEYGLQQQSTCGLHWQRIPISEGSALPLMKTPDLSKVKRRVAELETLDELYRKRNNWRVVE